MTVYYIDNSGVPGKTAHALQIEKTIQYLEKIIPIKIISYSNSKGLMKKNHIYFKTPSFFNKIIPLRSYHLLNKLGNINFNKEDIIYTRNPIIALSLFSKVKKIILEIHNIPHLKDGFIDYLFNLLVFYAPMRKLLKNDNVEYITITKSLKKDLIKMGFSNIYVIPDSVEVNLFDVNILKEMARKQLNLSLKEKYVVYTGSLQDWKGYKILLEASKYINARIVIVGAKENQIKNLKFKYPEVIFKEFIPQKNIILYLKVADVLVIPNSGKFQISANYTSPLKLFEYMVSKRPIVASDLPSIREIVSDDDVLFFEPDNPNDLAKKINYLIKNKKLQKKLSENAYKKSNKYTWDERAKKIIKLLKNN